MTTPIINGYDRPIVVDEHTLAFLFVMQPMQAQILKASAIRGSSFPQHGTIPILNNWRDATPQDFEDYGVSAQGYFGEPTIQISDRLFCPACPWRSKEEKDLAALTPAIREACIAGASFHCHTRGGGPCYGARLYRLENQPVQHVAQAPVRLCCGQRHDGPVCPDGKVMCCMCFTRVAQDQLHKTEDGAPEDVCLTCAQQEPDDRILHRMIKPDGGEWIAKMTDAEVRAKMAEGWHMSHPAYSPYVAGPKIWVHAEGSMPPPKPGTILVDTIHGDPRPPVITIQPGCPHPGKFMACEDLPGSY